EEYDMFSSEEGTLFTFLKNLGRPMQDTGKGSPFAALIDNDLLPQNTICVHMNILDDGDFDRIRENNLGEKLTMVHCPNCHAYFGRSPFPLKRFLDAGMSVSIGTDSLASNSELNLFSEMRTMKGNFPFLSYEEIIRMVTTEPARAIGHGERLGKLKPDAHADLIAIPVKCSASEAAEAIVFNQSPITWTVVAGQRL
ncbi:MAG: amidohydrolase family protein, partial [Chthoniobacterales bacterium]